MTQDDLREWRKRPHIMDSDVPAVAAALAPDVLWATESGSNLNVESAYASPRNTECSTVSEQWFTIKKMGVSQGRPIAPQEYQMGAPVVIVGQDVADHFFPNLNPIGRAVRIQGIPYTVVGVAEKQGSVFGMSLDKFLIAPERAPLNRWVNPHGVIDQMVIQGPSDEGMKEAMEAARAVMRGASPSAPVAERQLRARDVRFGARVLEQAAGLPDHRRHRAADGRAWSSARS